MSAIPAERSRDLGIGGEAGTGAESGTRVVFGPGVIRTLPAMLAAGHSKARVLVVLGSSSTGHEWRKWLLQSLEPLKARSWQHPPCVPTAATVQALSRQALASEADVLVAVGGGGVMDAAKAAVARIAEMEDGRRRVELVTAPTTPGTGAEVTPFATVWDFERRRKASIASRPPALAVVDPDLCAGLPQAALAASVMDSLVQGMEAAWSTRSTTESIGAGLTAVALVAQSGARLLDPRDGGARMLASLAGLWSGRAIAISHTTAAHALSYPLTARYGVRHGHACSVLAAAVLAFNAGTTEADCVDRRGVAHVQWTLSRILQALGAQTVDGARRCIVELRRAGGLCSYAQCDADDRLVARDAVSYGRLSNNPRLIGEAEIETLLENLAQSPEEDARCK